MPELPEVEIVRRGLEPFLLGQRVLDVELRREDLRFPFPERFCDRLKGCRVTALQRRAKYILATLSSNEVLIIHLGMTGRFSVRPGSGARRRGGGSARSDKQDAAASRILGDYFYESGGDPKHDHAVLRMSGGAVVTYNDPRRFGFMLLHADRDIAAHPLFSSLGVEPLSNGLDADFLARRAKGRRGDLKSFLMDQRVIAGLGNIYVSEALHRARLSPRRIAGTLASRSGIENERAEHLVREIRNVLTAALEAGGSTLRDYRHADGGSGSFQEQFSVYDREGAPCMTLHCSGAIRRIVQAGRSTFYCPRCQR